MDWALKDGEFFNPATKFRVWRYYGKRWVVSGPDGMILRGPSMRQRQFKTAEAAMVAADEEWSRRLAA